jgi:RNA polymerase sigma factor (sigma-70 family)
VNSQLAQEELGVLADAIRLGRLGTSSKKQKRQADIARNKLIEAYIPLAQKEASRYAVRLGRYEALSAAYFGLTMALKSWDPDKGALPSWIRLYCKNALLRDCDKQSLIKLPQAKAPKRAMVRHYTSIGKTDAEISEQTGYTISEMQHLMSLPSVEVWLDESDHDAPTSCSTGNSDTVLQVNNLLCGLPELERRVVAARFGIGTEGYVCSYEEISAEIGIDVDEVRKAEANGLAKLMTMQAQVSLR